MKLSCVNIATTNIPAMRDFYSLILNTDYFERNTSRYEIQIDNVCIVIMATTTKTPVNPDCCGLEFRVSDVDAEYHRLLDSGVHIENEPVTLPWHYRYFAVKDPDGNNVDFVQYVGESTQ